MYMPSYEPDHHAAGSGPQTELPSNNKKAASVIISCSNSATTPLPALPSFQSTAVVYQPVTLKFEDVMYKLQVKVSWWCGGGGGPWGEGEGEKSILKGISGLVRPGEMLAMLGPSGSGKTTLLTALAGRMLPAAGQLSGKITYNGHPFSLDSSMKRRTGFVAQDDVLYPHLTVSETLAFTALLRLPGTLTRADKLQQADRVIADLGLSRVAHTMIGGALFRGISGGERKRVSIGQEMLVNPSLLLLDEPTSGLDSTTALRILSTLKLLASEGGRTIVTTIHQPSSRLYHMFDKVILLSEGCPIYYGQPSDALHYFSSIGFSLHFLTANPADLMLDLANGINYVAEGSTDERDGKAVREELISAYHRVIATRLKAELCCAVDYYDNAAATNDQQNINGKRRRRRRREEYWSTSWWEEFRVLLRRGLKERRHEAFNKLRIFQVISVATLGGLLWWNSATTSHIQDRTSLLFFFSVFWGFYPLYNAVFTFPQERAMLIKERYMYRLSSYFMARTAGDLPMELALPTAFVLIIYWMGGLSPHPAAFILSLLIVLYSVLVAQSLGLAVGAILMDVKQATTLASVTTLVFLIAGGYYVQHIPPFIVWLKYLSYSFYCYKLLLGVQFSRDDDVVYDCPSSTGFIICRASQFPAIKSVGLDHTWLCVCTMALMLFGYRLLAYLALHRLRPR